MTPNSAQSKTEANDPSALIFEILSELSSVPPDAIGPESELVAELAFDSLGLLELVAAIEEALDLPPLDLTDAHEIVKVRDLERVVGEAQAQLRLY